MSFKNSKAVMSLKEDLSIVYTRKRINKSYSYPIAGGDSHPGTGAGWSFGLMIQSRGYAYEYHRYATKRFEYRGLDWKHAQILAQILIKKYNRDVWTNDWSTPGVIEGSFATIKTGNKLQANIYAERTLDCFYKVVVDINEDDVKYDVYGKLPYSWMFSKENERDYTEPTFRTVPDAVPDSNDSNDSNQ